MIQGSNIIATARLSRLQINYFADMDAFRPIISVERFCMYVIILPTNHPEITTKFWASSLSVILIYAKYIIGSSLVSKCELIWISVDFEFRTFEENCYRSFCKYLTNWRQFLQFVYVFKLKLLQKLIRFKVKIAPVCPMQISFCGCIVDSTTEHIEGMSIDINLLIYG